MCSQLSERATKGWEGNEVSAAGPTKVSSAGVGHTSINCNYLFGLVLVVVRHSTVNTYLPT